jgi:beta-glucosidase
VKDLIFPPGFLWGTATSAHQVEGNNTKNDWWEWEQAGKAPQSGKAIDHYHRFEEDFDLAKKMNTNAHRLSIEWSRIEPEEGQWDKKEVEHYKKVFAALKERGLKIMLTLFHFTSPLWFFKKGGFQNKKAPEIFARYVQFVAKEFGKEVDFWITLNEPVVYASQGYLTGNWPPGKKSIWATRRVLKNLVLAHKLSYQTIHQIIDNPKVGIASNLILFQPYPNRFMSRLMNKLADYFWNWSFLKKTKGYHDFIGINYYTRLLISKINLDLKKAVFDPQKIGHQVSDMGWEVYPDGFLEMILKAASLYKLPIYITENGIATDDEKQRICYLIDHLTALHQAISKGAEVKGYFYWSLLDNFEWSYGFWPHFGLIAVDRKTQKRIPKESSKIYSQIAKENRINR